MARKRKTKPIIHGRIVYPGGRMIEMRCEHPEYLDWAAEALEAAARTEQFNKVGLGRLVEIEISTEE